MDKQSNILIKQIALEIDKKGGTCYYVGGYVRDLLLGIDNKDYDIEVHNITCQDLEAILSLFGDILHFGKSFGVYNIAHYNIDFALPRKELSTGIAHTDFDITVDPFIGTYKAAIRRDFTINSIMKNVLTGEVIDHFHGLEDLKNKTIKHINDKTFIEDPLRVLRACQFASRFNFIIDNNTLNLCKSISINELSNQRIFLELEKALLKSQKPSIFFKYLDQMDKLSYWFPELLALKLVEQNPIYHKEGNVFNHTMLVLDEGAKLRDKVSNPLSFMLALLCHDFGKAISTTIKNDKIVSFKHEILGLDIVKTFISRLTNQKDIMNYVLNMVKLHMAPNAYIRNNSSTKSFNHLFYESVNPLDLIYVAEADNKGRISSSFEDNTNILLDKLNNYNELMEKPFINGKDLLDNGIKPSPKMSMILDYANKLRLAGVEKEIALKQVINYAKKLK